MHRAAVKYSLRRVHDGRQRGFTLVEVLVVLMIVSMLIVLSIPAMKGLTSTAGMSTAIRHISSMMTLARSHAIAKRTIVRFGIVTAWENDSEAAYRKYGLWEWDRAQEEFVPFNEWKTLPPGLVFENSRGDYLRTSDYARKDGSSVRGDFLPSRDAESFIQEVRSDRVRVVFFEFTPSGGVRFPGGEERNVLAVVVNGYFDPSRGGKLVYTDQEKRDWSQFNIDTLTGRVRIYRP
jgi:prepilin-type N-terminal cleavage/methylation domain-containing protein